MGREWKPGDVAMVELPSGGERASVMIGHDPSERCWHSAENNGDLRCLAAVAVAARPLVVIDPEDMDAFLSAVNARLPKGWWPESRALIAEAIAEAVRSTIVPPKPPEPTAMWSVVVDAAGDQWVRALGPDFMDGWVRAGDLPSNGKWTDYRDITAVRVLSEGVQP